MLDVVMNIVLAMLAVAMLLALTRMVLGPALQDRVVALDFIAASTVGVIVAAAAGTGQRALLDGAILIALVGFLGTVAYSWYVQKDPQQ
ncbi:MAG: Na(+)/H(+) antiporter subunit [Pseudomonadota bacterium]|jgi:multicomponent Na+:H+ antiporter subunit F